MIDLALNVLRCLAAFAGDIFFNVIYRAKAIGRENIPKSGGVLIASNHVAAMETQMVPYLTVDRFSSRRYWFPGKAELFKFPPAAWLFKSLRVIPVRRGGFDHAVMKRIAELANNDVVIIYPEGTRSKDGRLHEGRAAVGKIIYDSRTTVVPVAVFNTRYCMTPGAWFPNLFLPLWAVYGKPLDLRKYFDRPYDKKLAKEIVAEVMAAIANLQKEYAYLDKPPKGFLKHKTDDQSGTDSGSR
ncbi:MAG: lysophospholipid acyltransferase family protein [Nitrospinota bacterium]